MEGFVILANIALLSQEQESYYIVMIYTSSDNHLNMRTTTHTFSHENIHSAVLGCTHKKWLNYLCTEWKKKVWERGSNLPLHTWFWRITEIVGCILPNFDGLKMFAHLTSTSCWECTGELMADVETLWCTKAWRSAQVILINSSTLWIFNLPQESALEATTYQHTSGKQTIPVLWVALFHFNTWTQPTASH